MSITGFRISVTDHALSRGLERSGLGRGRIRGEVHEALHAGRVSARQPAWAGGWPDGRSLYTWTADGRRAYVLVATDTAFVVTTVLTRDNDRAEAAA